MVQMPSSVQPVVKGCPIWLESRQWREDLEILRVQKVYSKIFAVARQEDPQQFASCKGGSRMQYKKYQWQASRGREADISA